MERVVPRDGNVSDIIWCQELAIIVNQLTSRFLMLSFAQLLVTFFSLSQAHAPEILKQPCIIKNEPHPSFICYSNNALMSSCHQSKLASWCLIFNFFYHFLKSLCLLFSTVTTAIGGRCSKLSRERCMNLRLLKLAEYISETNNCTNKKITKIESQLEMKKKRNVGNRSAECEA